jgi:hypothetical protein
VSESELNGFEKSVFEENKNNDGLAGFSAGSLKQ